MTNKTNWNYDISNVQIIKKDNKQNWKGREEKQKPAYVNAEIMKAAQSRRVDHCRKEIMI